MTQMVDSGSGERLQIKSRVFAPGLGVDEDSVVRRSFPKAKKE